MQVATRISVLQGRHYRLESRPKYCHQHGLGHGAPGKASRPLRRGEKFHVRLTFNQNQTIGNDMNMTSTVETTYTLHLSSTFKVFVKSTDDKSTLMRTSKKIVILMRHEMSSQRHRGGIASRSENKTSVSFFFSVLCRMFCSELGN